MQFFHLSFHFSLNAYASGMGSAQNLICHLYSRVCELELFLRAGFDRQRKKRKHKM